MNGSDKIECTKCGRTPHDIGKCGITSKECPMWRGGKPKQSKNSAAINAIQEKLNAVNHNIKVYEDMHEYEITDEDRKKTLDDLNELKQEYEQAINKLIND